ncbi:MAG: DUF1992 domain-containing protein [Burkholderiales bacterium]|jgi:hypothetical protein|nr:DUF1992 domain-containing protein [Burkholderiales bacterium]
MMSTLDEEIARKLAEAEAMGELRSAPSFGKPMPDDEAWQQTPAALRMGFKILKNAGLAPPELALFHERAALRARLDAAAPAEQATLQQQLSELEQKIALRLESLRRHGNL